MSRYRRARVAGGCYFFTVVTERRQRILTDEPVRAALRAAIARVRETYPFKIDAWVLLPDHMHTIWTLPPNDSDFSLRWRLIKTYVTRACSDLYFNSDMLTKRRCVKRCGTFWQHRYFEHVIRDAQDFMNHIDYVHFNPVKHSLVDNVCDWPYSSFHRYCAQGVYAQNWAGIV